MTVRTASHSRRMSFEKVPNLPVEADLRQRALPAGTAAQWRRQTTVIEAEGDALVERLLKWPSSDFAFLCWYGCFTMRREFSCSLAAVSGRPGYGHLLSSFT